MANNYNTYRNDFVSANRLKQPDLALVRVTSKVVADLTDMATRGALDVLQEAPPIHIPPYENRSSVPPSAEGITHMYGGEATERVVETQVHDDFAQEALSDGRADQVAAAQSSVANARPLEAKDVQIS